MQTIIKKLKLIYLPFLLLAVSFMVLYTGLNGVLIKTNTTFGREEVTNYWLPFGLPMIMVLIWLRPRIKLLRLTGGNGNLPFLYGFFAGLAIAIPTVIAQIYLEKAMGELTPLETISGIDSTKPTKYYSLKHYYIDKTNIGVHTAFAVGGKHNESLGMSIYVALPIFEEKADTINTSCVAWLGVEFSERISNRLDEKEKERLFQAFSDRSQHEFEQKDVSQFVYLERTGNNADGAGFAEAARKSTKYDTRHLTVLLPMNEPFDSRNGNTFGWIFGAFAIGGGVWLIMVLLPGFDKKQLRQLEGGKPFNNRDLEVFWLFIIPKQKFLITPVFLYINVLVFMAMVLSGLGVVTFQAKDLLSWGGNLRSETVNGEWWRLVTSMFLHGGLMHLVANMVGFMFVGVFLEPLLGSVKYFTVYMLTGILASVASIWWSDASVSVGASGAIFGLYGLFLALLLTKVFPPDFSKAFLSSIVMFIGFNLLVGLFGGVDNAAHIGGLLSGFISGLILTPWLKKHASNDEKPVKRRRV